MHKAASSGYGSFRYISKHHSFYARLSTAKSSVTRPFSYGTIRLGPRDGRPPTNKPTTAHNTQKDRQRAIDLRRSILSVHPDQHAKLLAASLKSEDLSKVDLTSKVNRAEVRRPAEQKINNKTSEPSYAFTNDTMSLILPQADFGARHSRDTVLNNFVGSTNKNKQQIVEEALGIAQSMETPISTLEKSTKDSRATLVNRQFNLLGLLGEKFKKQAADVAKEDTTTPANDVNTDFESLSVNDAEDVDWGSLPLSPLIRRDMIKARKKFRTPKPSYRASLTYDNAIGDRFAADPLAQALTTPIRVCRMTRSRLPEAFLLRTKPIMNPATGDIFELPTIDHFDHLSKQLELAPKNTPHIATPSHLVDDFESEKEHSKKAPKPEISETALSELAQIEHRQTNLGAMSAQTSPKLAHHDRMETPMTKVEDFDPVRNNSASRDARGTSSYLLKSMTTVHETMNMEDKQYKRSTTHLWHSVLGKKAIHRRNDLAMFVRGLLEKDIVHHLRLLPKSPDADRTVQLCMDNGECQLPELGNSTCLNMLVALHFGSEHTIETSRGNSWTNAVDSIARSAKAQIHNDLFLESSSSLMESKAVRIQRDRGIHVILYDMTKLLQPDFLAAARSAGYQERTYWILPVIKTQMIRRALWSFAHYIGTIPCE